MKNKLLILVTALIIGLTSCGTPRSLYSWYNYDSNLYSYNKKRTEKEEKALVEAYEKIINKQRGIRNTIPPGICAEYGFMLIEKGNISEGITYLKREVALYPESSIFINRIIAQYEN